MFGFLHVALLFAFLAYHIQTTCPINEPCLPEAGVTCAIVHKFAPQLLDTYNAVGIKLPDLNDYAYFQELKKVSNDFLGIREKDAVDPSEEAQEEEGDTFATSQDDETIEDGEQHVHDPELTPAEDDSVSEQEPEEIAVPEETAVVADEAEPVEDSHIPSEQQKIVENAAEIVEEIAEEIVAAEAIELAAEIGANL